MTASAGGKRAINEPTKNVATGIEERTFQQIQLNEIGRQTYPVLKLREERQSKVDAFVVIRMAGEQ